MHPSEYLLLLLHDHRALGWSFEDAWPRCSRLAAETGDDPREWLVVFGETREAWRRAYDRETPARREVAAAAIAEDRPPLRDELDGRRCEWCDKWIPADRDPRARYCSDRHRREAGWEQERLAKVGVAP